ncbi:BlaI/MecI/CopY family transcriptional regulator [Kitasatospora sp. NPDC049258]|uniref:BlaI/MecI/CopY family transcriptional regulator n=1 Tax=Kitasatospora sp. NPDC049258 TaxID=3155394 RepID=UPI003447238B
MTEATRRQAGELEGAVLAALWAAGRPLTGPEVQRLLPGEPARTTIATILARLHEKGTVRRTRHGRGFAYHPAVEDPSALTAQRMHTELDRGGDRSGVLARFISRLSTDDEQLVRALLESPASPADRREQR